jgi:cytochrome c556
MRAALVKNGKSYTICSLDQLKAALQSPSTQLVDLYEIDAEDDAGRIKAEARLANQLAEFKLEEAKQYIAYDAGSCLLAKAEWLRDAVEDALALAKASCY